jgi:hypothetical protein
VEVAVDTVLLEAHQLVRLAALVATVETSQHGLVKLLEQHIKQQVAVVDMQQVVLLV